MFVSSYNVTIPIRKENKYIIFNGYTGAIDILSVEIVGKLLRHSANKKIIIQDNFDDKDLIYLKERGFITELNYKNEISLVEILAHKKFLKLKSLPKTIEIIPSYNCQLQCLYCFEREAQAQGKSKGWLSTVLSKNFVDYIFSAIKNINCKKKIGIYGGEPFMPDNRECIEYILKKGIIHGYSFLVTTNGVDLDKYLDLIDYNKISCIRITMNGSAKSHDKIRCFKDYSPTYYKILSNLKQILNRDIEIQIRIDVTRDVLDSLVDFAEELINIGFDKNNRAFCFCVAVHPVGNCLCNDSLKEQYISDAEIIDYLNDHPELDNIFRPSQLLSPRIEALFNSDIENALIPIHCDASIGIFVFDPFGNIYPCNKVVGIEKNKIGTFVPQLSIGTELVEKWYKHAAHFRSECTSCKFVFLCGGGCLYLKNIKKQNDFKFFCVEYKKFFYSIMLYYYRRLGRESLVFQYINT